MSCSSSRICLVCSERELLFCRPQYYWHSQSMSGMLIVDQTMLNTAVSNGIATTGPDSNSYTFGNSARNIFTGQTTSMYGLFRDKTCVHEDIGWDVSNVTDMTFMFRGASAFNKNIFWDVGKVVIFGWNFSRCNLVQSGFKPYTSM